MAVDPISDPVLWRNASSQVTALALKQYRRRLHEDNEQIRASRQAGSPLRDARTGQPLRTLSNDSINKTVRTLTAILDEAEDAGWVSRNVARGRRTREPVERQRHDALEPDEFLSLLEAASQLDNQRHKPQTLAWAHEVRALRNAGIRWNDIAARLQVAATTAIYLDNCEPNDLSAIGPRRAVIVTLGLAGLRVSKLCGRNNQDIDLTKARIQLLDELSAYRTARPATAMDAPAFPNSSGGRRDRNNVSTRVIEPAVKRANLLRAERTQPPIIAHVTPHTLRRTYITFMLAAGFDVPYVQDQVGHADPTTTLAIYARVIRRADRNTLRSELRAMLGEDRPATDELARRKEITNDRRSSDHDDRKGVER